MPRALISVSDKTGIVEFAKRLEELGWEIVSTGGTAQAVIEADAKDVDVRRLLAEKVFEHTAAYDSAIAQWFADQRQELFPATFTAAFERAQTLRYGENPGQAASFYVEQPGAGLAGLSQR